MKYQKSSDHRENRQSVSKEANLVASSEQDHSALAEISDFEHRMLQRIGISVEEGSKLEIEEMKAKVNQLSWKEKRDIRREIKTELKQLNLEARNAYSPDEVQRVHQISEMMRWSIIIGSVGLVLLILGAIFSGILTFFGAIFVVGAAVLFILDQV